MDVHGRSEMNVQEHSKNQKNLNQKNNIKFKLKNKKIISKKKVI
jgi:hypothetical protein